MNLVRLIRENVVDEDIPAFDFNLVAGNSDDALHERRCHVRARRRAESDDIAPIDLSARQPVLQGCRKVPRKRNLIEEEMVSDHDRGDHRGCRNPVSYTHLTLPTSDLE